MAELREDTQTATKLTDDEILDKLETSKKAGEETPSATSTEKKPEETETEETSDTGTDQQKTEKSEDEKVEVPKEFHKHPAWQRILKERDSFKRMVMEFKDKMEEFNKVTSSSSYIRESMKAEGYKDEVIDARLRELGHKIPLRETDDLTLIGQKLNMDVSTLDDQTKALVGDVAKITRIILDDWSQKNLPSVIKPLEEGLGKISQSANASKLFNDMQKVIKDEGILDFAKDIEPELNKFVDENSEASQEDVFEHFKDLNHKLSLERWKIGKKKETRDEQKKGLRSLKEGASLGTLKLGDKKVSDDEVLDAIGYRE